MMVRLVERKIVIDLGGDLCLGSRLGYFVSCKVHRRGIGGGGREKDVRGGEKGIRGGGEAHWR